MTVDDLEKRVASLEKSIRIAQEWTLAEDALSEKREGQFMALLSIVAELAEKAGVKLEDFDVHFSVRARWWHDHLLRKAEDISPELAANLDRRTEQQSSVVDSYPSIFDAPPSEES